PGPAGRRGRPGGRRAGRGGRRAPGRVRRGARRDPARRDRGRRCRRGPRPRRRSGGARAAPARAGSARARRGRRGGGPRRGRDRGMGPHARRRGRARAGPVRGARRRRARGPGARGALRGAGTVSQRATSPGPPGRGREPLLDGVRDRLVRAAAGPGPGPGATAGETPDDTAVADALRASGRVPGSTARRALTRTAHAEIFGAGPLQRFLDEPGVTDVLVNGPDDVWVDRGAGLERVDVALGGPEAVRALAVRLAAAGGQRLDDAAPVVDARLPDGTRLHAVVAPVCAAGAVISLRVLRTRTFGIADLVAGGTVPPAWEPLLRGLVARRASVLVSGGTGTGKTTLLAALLALVPPDERIVCVEEARELDPDHPHVVPLTARRPNVEGAGGVDLADLVRAALRMRPDRIVLGECRGAEVREVLMALNTGHEGGLATI